MHPEELYMWPKSVPLLYNQSIFFLMAKRKGNSLIFDSAHLGVLAYDKKASDFTVSIQNVNNIMFRK